ncbi:MAG: PilN domain-containing protein [Synechococcales bacterium]|nr:PilN domain-containing protein [Synechococcales bacterium]
MYSLDVNFLNDRDIRPDVGDKVRGGAAGGQINWTPAIVGAIVGLLPVAGVLGSWLLLQNLNAGLEERRNALTAQIAAQGADEQAVADAVARAEQAEADARALVTVFDQIKPWSAMLQNVRDTVPGGIQVTSVDQAEGEQADQITITGYAVSFDDVNDFLLVLRRSPFINAEGTNLQSASLTNYPIDFELPENAPSGTEVRIPQVVQYSIVAQLTDLPASELLPELENTLAVGLTSRIQALQDKGAFQQ